MKDLREIQHDNRKLSYPSSLARGKYRLKHNPTATNGAIYADRKGREYLLSLADSLLWERTGEVAEAPTLFPFAE